VNGRASGWASFGFRPDYTLRRLHDADPISEWLAPLIERVVTFMGADTRIAQIPCTEYDTGVGTPGLFLASARAGQRYH
jgi:hypothetical protein